MKKLLALSLALATMSASAVEYTGVLNCNATNTTDEGTDTVVVYVNGIGNKLGDAEASRVALKNALGDKCPTGTCTVQKFYNQEHGVWGDTRELNAIGALERDAANTALIGMISMLKSDAKTLLNRGISTDIDFELDTTEALDDLLDTARTSSGDSVVPFSTVGSDVVGWLKGEVESTFSTDDPNKSVYLYALTNYEAQYKRTFQSSYQSSLRSYYLSRRAFYDENEKAMSAVTESVEGLTSFLVEHILSGKKVVVVAHSQGNHIIELSHSLLRSRLSGSQLEALQVVGAASVASSSPNDSYLSWDGDHTVMRYYDNSNDGDPLTANFTNGEGATNEDRNDHNFVDVYLNDGLFGNYRPSSGIDTTGIDDYLASNKKHSMREWLVGLVASGIHAASPIITQLDSDGFITTTLRWELYDDMDLHTKEPTGEVVYYRDKSGDLGKLDKDDTNGFGPEHYVANLTCEEVANKQWQFGIHQYKNGGEAENAHISVKLGGQVVKTRSYSNPSWPGTPVYVVNVNFGELTESQKMTYSISMNDFL
ncbi:hypothetical protein AB6D66_00755 [Vibrio pomeroyi]|uniref:Alpha/beta hydrolase n=1 Tax=Vibrio pomeroyi TaxID=198832 RepID=A0ABV4MR25_9VIBR|nr:hypothetical protein [Vibrio atlanticus]MCZ4311408.1 hypothetical protein [Vibrio atlanticus]